MSRRPQTSSSMSKADFALLQRQLAARSVREKTTTTTTTTTTMTNTMTTTTRPASMSGPRGTITSQTLFGGGNQTAAAMTGPFGSISTQQSPQLLPALSSSPKPAPTKAAAAPTGSHGDAVDSELIKSLSTKVLNTKTGFRRKVQAKLKKKNAAFDSTPNLLSLKEDTVYMPKGERVDPNRKDGITLSQLYSFKKADTWGRVFEAQAKADAVREIKEKKEKEMKDITYGSQLQQQLDDLNKAHAEYVRTDVHFTTDYFAHKLYEKDESRKLANARKVDDFKPLIFADIAFKDGIREAEVMDDISANEATLRRIRAELVQEEQKKLDKKVRDKEQLDRLVRENDALLKLKAKQKAVLDAEDRRINQQAIERAEREDKRRKDDFEAMMAKCAGGDRAGHRIVAALQKAKAEKEELFYQSLVTAENLITKQTMASEAIARARKEKDGNGLSDDWELMRKLREQRQREDADHTRKTIAYNQMKAREDAEREAERQEKRRQAQLKYRNALNIQLEMVHRRAYETLAKTMSNAELGLNSQLLKTTGVEG